MNKCESGWDGCACEYVWALYILHICVCTHSLGLSHSDSGWSNMPICQSFLHGLTAVTETHIFSKHPRHTLCFRLRVQHKVNFSQKQFLAKWCISFGFFFCIVSSSWMVCMIVFTEKWKHFKSEWKKMSQLLLNTGIIYIHGRIHTILTEILPDALLFNFSTPSLLRKFSRDLFTSRK